ncbi:MAG: alpha/beta fold hydrolase, partial [Enterovibrio sp.]
MQNRSGELSVDGAKIYYELSGNPDGTPLLMLHGGLGSLNELSPLHHHVGADHLLISVDFRGHGKSLLGERPLSYQQYQ